MRFVVLILLCVLSSCVTPARQRPADPQSWEPHNADFRSFYGWDEKVGSWDLERIVGAGGETAIHIFRPPPSVQAQGTVFLLHGYLDHSALRVPLVLDFVKLGWMVVGVDLPGHGLSSGNRGDIDGFDSYRLALESAMNLHDWPKPWRAVGHSTGAAAILTTIQHRGSAEAFDFIVLESPLVRSFMWGPSIWLKNMAEGEVEKLPRRSAKSQAEEPYRQLIMKEPLYISTVPLHFVTAVEAYYRSTLEWKPMKGRMLILQGKRDTALDVDYNVPFLRSIFPEAEIVEIERGRHHLFMDAGPAGDEARAALFSRW